MAEAKPRVFSLQGLAKVFLNSESEIGIVFGFYAGAHEVDPESLDVSANLLFDVVRELLTKFVLQKKAQYRRIGAFHLHPVPDLLPVLLTPVLDTRVIVLFGIEGDPSRFDPRNRSDEVCRYMLYHLFYVVSSFFDCFVDSLEEVLICISDDLVNNV